MISCLSAFNRIFVDAVVNHMAGAGRSGVGSAGTSFETEPLNFPGVPYTEEHFTPKDICPSGDGKSVYKTCLALIVLLTHMKHNAP